MLPGLGLVFHRRTRRLRLAVALIVGVVCFVDLLHAWHAHGRVHSSVLQPTNIPERIFIASLHWNSESVLKDAWSDSLLKLVDSLGGAANSNNSGVYVSIYESGSWDGTKHLLSELDKKLGERSIPRRVILDSRTHADEIKPPAKAKGKDSPGWITDSTGEKHRRRIPYLASLRNNVLTPLLAEKKKGIVYDKVLFVEDIIFTASDALELLTTRNGDYSAACSLDATKAPLLYDTFALRDSEGQEPLMLQWPFFRSRASRSAVLRGKAVPVQSCWNGMVAMDAAPFYNGLQFRGLPDSLAESHLEASECCLIHADNAANHKAGKGVWMNTNVRVGYNKKAYEGVHPQGQGQHQNRPWLSSLEIAYGLWANRLRRWTTTTWFKERIVDARMAAWQKKAKENTETGRHCIVNEMQVLVENGWAHV